MHSWRRAICCYIWVFCLLLMVAAPALARTSATLGQKAVGQPCGSLENSSDFDTLVQCTSSAAGTSGVKQTAPVILGTVTAPPYAAVACDSSKAGMLQWTGTAFQGCNGSTWLTLGGGATNTASNPFSFIDRTGVPFDTTIISNAITLGGFSGQLFAVCNPSCTGMYRNGIAVGMSANFSAGDTIAIELTSASTGLTATTASVTLGTTTSATWTVTTNPNACLGTPAIGTRCDDGTIYIGISPDGGEKLFAAPCRGGEVWNGTSCNGTSLRMQWNDGTNPDTVATGFTSQITGQANTAGLAARGFSPSPAPYQAAQFCATLVVGGHDDWYLPSRNEAEVLRVANGFGDIYLSWGNNGIWWTSTETAANTAWYMGEYAGSHSKSNFNLVWCVRRVSS